MPRTIYRIDRPRASVGPRVSNLKSPISNISGLKSQISNSEFEQTGGSLRRLPPVDAPAFPGTLLPNSPRPGRRGIGGQCHPELIMSRMIRPLRWLMLIASGCVLLQATTGCTQQLIAIQTALLGGIAYGVYILARNV